jgi:hypothetical protein
MFDYCDRVSGVSFAAWVESFGGVDVPSDLDGLDAALFHQDRFAAKLAMAVGEMDAARAWEADGVSSPSAWLRARGLTHAEAHRLVLLGRRLRRLPVLADSWLRGDLNGGQVQVINMHVIERHVELFASHEAELVPTLVGLTVTETARAMSVWRARADALNEGPAPRDPVCEATLSRTLDDRGVLHASLDAEGVALATAALNIADSHNLDVPACQRRGQALKDVLRWFLDHQDIKTTGRKRPHLNISIVGDTIHTDHVEGFDIETGVRFDSATLRRYLCDCEFHRLLLSSEGVVLDYGRLVKDPPVELYNAVVARDRKCRGYGCDRPASWCHVHHVKWWDRDRGTTEINNLVLLCARCHGVVHRKGFHAVLHPNGQFDVTTPWGETRTTHPPGARPLAELDWAQRKRCAARRRTIYTEDGFVDLDASRALILARLKQPVAA